MELKDINMLEEGLTLGMRWNDVVKHILEYTKIVGDLSIYGVSFTKEDTEESIAKKLYLEKKLILIEGTAELHWCQTAKTPV